MLSLLRRQTAQDSFQGLVKQSPFGMAIITHEARIVQANQAFLGLLGGSKPDSVGVNTCFDQLPSTQEFTPLRTRLKLAFGSDAAIAPINITISAQPDRVLRFFFSPLPFSPGRRSHLAVYCSDVSREQEHERELYRALQLADLGKLAGGVAHDLNNHLTALVGYSELLLQAHPANQEVCRDIENIRRSAQSASALIRQFLAKFRTNKPVAANTETVSTLASLRPVADAGDQTAEISKTAPVSVDRKNYIPGAGRLLLVEDEDGIREFMARSLRRLGHQVLEASDGLGGLHVFQEHKSNIDLVVSDVIMPEMDGPTMFGEMQKTHPDLKVIFVSGYPKDKLKNLLDVRAKFSFLSKPFTPAQLGTVVKQELERATISVLDYPGISAAQMAPRRRHIRAPPGDD